jgi:hypothetical protein
MLHEFLKIPEHRFHTCAEVRIKIVKACKNNPDIAKHYNIGKSQQKRVLDAVVLGKGVSLYRAWLYDNTGGRRDAKTFSRAGRPGDGKIVSRQLDGICAQRRQSALVPGNRAAFEQRFHAKPQRHKEDFKRKTRFNLCVFAPLRESFFWFRLVRLKGMFSQISTTTDK